MKNEVPGSFIGMGATLQSLETTRIIQQRRRRSHRVAIRRLSGHV